MLVLGIVLTALVALSGAQEKACGKIFTTEAGEGVSGRIIGAADTDSSPYFYPWHLALEYLNTTTGSWEYGCGATLIYDSWAITTGRCVEDASLSYRIVAGDYDRAVDDGSEQYIDVAEVTTHPGYDYTLPFLANNLALLSLASAVDLTTNFTNPICLPEPTDIFVESPNCYVTGWGVAWLNSTDAISSTKLRRGGIDVIETEFYCLVRIGGPYDVNDDQTCIMDQANRQISLCSGDFGGPLSCLKDGSWYAAGIASHTTNGLTDPTCDPMNPQIVSKTTSYLQWIGDVTGRPQA